MIWWLNTFWYGQWYRDMYLSGEKYFWCFTSGSKWDYCSPEPTSTEEANNCWRLFYGLGDDDTDYSESEFSRSLPRAAGYAMASARKWPQVTISVKFGAKPPSLKSPGGTFAHRNEPNREDVKYNVFGPILVENFFSELLRPKVNCPPSLLFFSLDLILISYFLRFPIQ